MTTNMIRTIYQRLIWTTSHRRSKEQMRFHWLWIGLFYRLADLKMFYVELCCSASTATTNIPIFPAINQAKIGKNVAESGDAAHVIHRPLARALQATSPHAVRIDISQRSHAPIHPVVPSRRSHCLANLTQNVSQMPRPLQTYPRRATRPTKRCGSLPTL